MNIQRTMKIFNEVKHAVLKKFDMNFVTISICPDAEEEALLCKKYAHTFCEDYMSICVAPQIESLQDNEIRAILWREFGRLIAGRNSDDAKAEKTIERYYGIKVSDFSVKPCHHFKTRLKIA